MNKDFDPGDRHEYERLYRHYVEKVNSAGTALATHGIDSPQFAEADKRAGEAWKKYGSRCFGAKGRALSR